MADEPDDNALELTNVVDELGIPEREADTDTDVANENGEEDEFSIEIDGEIEEDETPLVKQLRDLNRDQARELAEYRKTTKPKIEVGPKPTLEDSDYDEEKFEAALTKWHDDKRAADTAEQDEQRQAEIRNQEGQRRANHYLQQMGSIPLPQEEKDKAHETVAATLPPMLQAAVLKYCNKPANVVLALAKHPAVLERLAAEEDPIAFILQVTKLEEKLKMVNRKKPPAAESGTILSGSASSAVAKADKAENDLWAKYERSGSDADLQAFRTHMKTKRKAA